jgi:hypothetical protein
VWQEVFEQYGDDTFTVVGLALDAEGIPPAKLYYDQFGVTFPSLVDPNYATRFGAVPKTFFVDEHGVVMELKDWKQRLTQLGELAPVSDTHRAQWSRTESRLDTPAIARLAEAHQQEPGDLAIATQLGSRYNALGLSTEAGIVLRHATDRHDAKAVARTGGADARLLGQAYLQLARSCVDNRENQVRYATLAFYLSPTVGFGKQIARIIDPAKFDGRPNGDFDNRFREGTLRRLTREREAWLAD